MTDYEELFMNDITAQLKEIKEKVDALSDFKSKLLGGAAMLSLIVSVIVGLAVKYL